MTRHVPMADLKDHISEYVAAAESGEEIIITRHGKLAAKLVPVIDRGDRARRVEEATRQIREHIARMRAEGRTATREERRAWIDEGRR